jgi:hypothetical protein
MSLLRLFAILNASYFIILPFLFILKAPSVIILHYKTRIHTEFYCTCNFPTYFAESELTIPDILYVHLE